MNSIIYMNPQGYARQSRQGAQFIPVYFETAAVTLFALHNALRFGQWPNLLKKAEH